MALRGRLHAGVICRLVPRHSARSASFACASAAEGSRGRGEAGEAPSLGHPTAAADGQAGDEGEAEGEGRCQVYRQQHTRLQRPAAHNFNYAQATPLLSGHVPAHLFPAGPPPRRTATSSPTLDRPKPLPPLELTHAFSAGVEPVAWIARKERALPGGGGAAGAAGTQLSTHLFLPARPPAAHPPCGDAGRQTCRVGGHRCEHLQWHIVQQLGVGTATAPECTPLLQARAPYKPPHQSRMWSFSTPPHPGCEHLRPVRLKPTWRDMAAGNDVGPPGEMQVQLRKPSQPTRHAATASSTLAPAQQAQCLHLSAYTPAGTLPAPPTPAHRLDLKVTNVLCAARVAALRKAVAVQLRQAAARDARAQVQAVHLWGGGGGGMGVDCAQVQPGQRLHRQRPAYLETRRSWQTPHAGRPHTPPAAWYCSHSGCTGSPACPPASAPPAPYA